MEDIYIENRADESLTTNAIAEDIVRHLYATQFSDDKAIVIAADAVGFSRLLRDLWLVRMRELQQRIAISGHSSPLLDQLARMQSLLFVPRSPDVAPEAQVHVVEPAQLSDLSGTCRTLYVACSLREVEITKLSKFVSETGLLVLYGSFLDDN